MKEKIGLSVLIQEIFFFAATAGMAVMAAEAVLASPAAVAAEPVADGMTWWEFLLFFSVATTVFLLFGKFLRRPWPLRVLLLTALFFGSLISLGALFGDIAVFISAVLVAVYAVRPFLLLHNVVLTLALAGVAASLGSALAPAGAIAVLVALSVYDIIAVHLTRHMVAMLREMLSAGAVFAMVFPRDWRDYFKFPRREMRRKSEGLGKGTTAESGTIREKPGDFALLGSGDFVFPAMLAVSALSSSAAAAWTVLAFSSIGLAVMHLIFIRRGGARPMAALPPLAAFAILGYLTAHFCGF